MKLPKKINIMSINYSVIYFDNPYDVYEDPYAAEPTATPGYVDLIEEEIRIFKGNRDVSSIWQTIINKLLYITLSLFKLNIAEGNAEKINVIIDNIATTIVDILIRNKLCFKKSKLPEKINLFGINYKVYYTEKTSDVDPVGRTPLLGTIDFVESAIGIYVGTRSIEATWQTLWHEIFHGILDSLHIHFDEEDDDKEDDLIDVFAIELNDIMFRNKFCFEETCVTKKSHKKLKQKTNNIKKIKK